MRSCRLAFRPLPLLLWLASGPTSVRTFGHLADADGVRDLVSSGASSNSENVASGSAISDHTSCNDETLCNVLRHIDTSLEPTPADMVDGSEEETDHNSWNLISPDNSFEFTIKSRLLHDFGAPGTHSVATPSLWPEDTLVYDTSNPLGRLYCDHFDFYNGKKNLHGFQSQGRQAASQTISEALLFTPNSKNNYQLFPNAQQQTPIPKTIAPTSVKLQRAGRAPLRENKELMLREDFESSPFSGFVSRGPPNVKEPTKISALARPAFPLEQPGPVTAFNPFIEAVRDAGLAEPVKPSRSADQGSYPLNCEDHQSQDHTSLDFTRANIKPSDHLNSQNAHWDDVHANEGRTVSAQDLLALGNFVSSRGLSPHALLVGEHGCVGQLAKIDHSEFDAAHRKFVDSVVVNSSKALSSVHEDHEYPSSVETYANELRILNPSIGKHLSAVNPQTNSFEARRQSRPKTNRLEHHLKPRPAVGGKLESASQSIGEEESSQSHARSLREFLESEDPKVFPGETPDLRLTESKSLISEEVMPSSQKGQLVITEAKEKELGTSKPSSKARAKEVTNEAPDESVVKTENPSNSGNNHEEGKPQTPLRNKKDEKLFKKLLRKEKVQQKKNRKENIRLDAEGQIQQRISQSHETTFRRKVHIRE